MGCDNVEMTVVEPVLKKFRSALDAMYGERLDRVVLFGSRARGNHAEDSDYDVAVFLKTFADRWLEADKIAATIELLAPAVVPPVVPGDIDDDQVIAAAVAAQADLIVSGDRRHLLPLGTYAGIAIIDAADALRRIEAIQA
jgi:predicted nucleotidyltransferase